MRVLDLGCGTGKQIFSLIGRILPGGTIAGLDLSAQAVAAVRERAFLEKRDSVSAVAGSFETCLREFRSTRFDLILSTYAIYYAADMVGLLSDLSGLLAPGGRLFASGPGRGTNSELLDLLKRISKSEVPDVEDFLKPDDVERISGYKERRVVRLNNQVLFEDPESLMNWWSHHNSFRADLEDQVRAELRALFARSPRFGLTKNVLGVLLHA